MAGPTGPAHRRHEFPGEVVYSREFSAVPGAVSRARQLARMALVSWHLPCETAETAELLISEIFTNAVKFGGSLKPKCPEPGCADSVGLVLRLHADELVIEVSDSNQIPPVLVDSDYETEYGRGLWLVEMLSRKWGFHPHPSGGKTVHCVMAIDRDSHHRTNILTGQGESEMISGRHTALWSGQRPQKLVITDTSGNVIDSYPVSPTGDRPQIEMLHHTGWSHYPGSEWHEEPTGEWSIAVYRHESVKEWPAGKEGRLSD